MRTTAVSTNTTDTILSLLRTLPQEELDVIAKKIVSDLIPKQIHVGQKMSKKKKYFLKTKHIDMDYNEKTFDRNYLYENTR